MNKISQGAKGKKKKSFEKLKVWYGQKQRCIIDIKCLKQRSSNSRKIKQIKKNDKYQVTETIKMSIEETVKLVFDLHKDSSSAKESQVLQLGSVA